MKSQQNQFRSFCKLTISNNGVFQNLWIFSCPDLYDRSYIWILSRPDQNQIRVWTRSGQNSDFIFKIENIENSKNCKFKKFKIRKTEFWKLFNVFKFSIFQFLNFYMFWILSRLGPDWSLVTDKNLDMKKSRLWTKSGLIPVMDSLWYGPYHMVAIEWLRMMKSNQESWITIKRTNFEQPDKVF